MNELVELVRQYQGAATRDEARAAAGALLRIVGPKLRAYVLGRLSPSAGEEVFSEVLHQIIRSLHQFRGEEDGAVWAWCYRITKRLVGKEHGQVHPESLDVVIGGDLTPAFEFAAKRQPLSQGERLDLEHAMSMLAATKPPCVGYLWSHFVWEWSYTEMAREFGKTYDAVRVAVARCLELAQSLLREKE